MRNALGSFLVLLMATHASARTALVYHGEGACENGCVRAASKVAREAGLEVRLVGAGEVTDELLSGAAAWVQPGGVAYDAARALADSEKDSIRRFVANGGAYLGFCAGAFFLDGLIDAEDQVRGLGILPGAVQEYLPQDAAMFAFLWEGYTRYVYFEEGAYFEPEKAAALPGISGLDTVATFPDGAAAAIRFHYLKGRVAASGAHPEAPASWKREAGVVDADGPDLDLAVGLLRWAVTSGSRTAE